MRNPQAARWDPLGFKSSGHGKEDGIESNFPPHFRTKETADLFLALIVRLLKKDGRAAVVVPIETTPLARWNARPIGSHQLIACMPGAGPRTEYTASSTAATSSAINTIGVPIPISVPHQVANCPLNAMFCAPGTCAAPNAADGRISRSK
jgi:hypothetical protein